MELSQIEQQQAANLWDILMVHVKFKPSLRRWDKHDFLGFADIQIQVRSPEEDAKPEINAVRKLMAGLDLYLNGCKVKILPNGNYLEMKQEKGSNNKYYSIFAPGTKTMRALLDVAVFTHPEVKAAIQQIQQMPKPAHSVDTDGRPAASAHAGSNPFDGE